MTVILAIDDRPEILTSIGLVLGERHTCLMSRGGREAIETYVGNRPSLVLLDLKMPDMQGEEVARAILDRDPKARIVVFSVVENVRRVVDLFRLGVRDFLAKPCDPEALLRVVESNLRGPSVGKQVRTPTTDRIRARMLESLRAGRVPVLMGPPGLGKRTEMRAAMRELGVDHPVTLGPLPRRDAGPWLKERLHLGAGQTGGIVLWGPGRDRVPFHLRTRSYADTYARRSPAWTEGIHFGIAWDASDSEVTPPPGGPFDSIFFPPLGRRPEELGSILAQFGGSGRGGSDFREEEIARLSSLLRAEPGLGRMRLLGALARFPDLWRFLRERGGK